MNSSKKKKTNILQPQFFSLVAFLLLFGFFAYSFFQSYSPLSGAEVFSGTVNLNILGSNPSTGGEEAASRAHGRGSLLSLELEVIPKEITITLQQFHGNILELLFRNRSGDKTFSFVLSSDVPILRLGETRITLSPGAEKKISVQVDSSQTGIFIGRLSAEGNFVFKQLPVLVNIFSQGPYQVTAALPAMYQHISSTQDISAEIIFSPLSGDSLDVTYLIKNEENIPVLEEHETLAATQTTLSFQKTFDLPLLLPLGRYYLIVSANYRGVPAEDVTFFDVVENIPSEKEYPLAIYHQNPLIFFIIVLAILLLHILMTWRKEKYI